MSLTPYSAFVENSIAGNPSERVGIQWLPGTCLAHGGRGSVGFNHQLQGGTKVARFATGLVVVLAVGLVGAASAQAAEFEGQIKGEPDTSLTLKVKNIEGDRYVTRIEFKKIPLECEGGKTHDQRRRVGWQAWRTGRRDQGRRVQGPWNYGKLSGKVRGGGKIAGTISLKTDAGGSLGDCKSGDLDYVVHD